MTQLVSLCKHSAVLISSHIDQVGVVKVGFRNSVPRNALGAAPMHIVVKHFQNAVMLGKQCVLLCGGLRTIWILNARHIPAPQKNVAHKHASLPSMVESAQRTTQRV